MQRALFELAFEQNDGAVWMKAVDLDMNCSKCSYQGISGQNKFGIILRIVRHHRNHNNRT